MGVRAAAGAAVGKALLRRCPALPRLQLAQFGNRAAALHRLGKFLPGLGEAFGFGGARRGHHEITSPVFWATNALSLSDAPMAVSPRRTSSVTVARSRVRCSSCSRRAGHMSPSTLR